MRGLIHREQVDTVAQAISCSLTGRGRELLPVLQAIVGWGLTGAHEEILGLAPAAPGN